MAIKKKTPVGDLTRTARANTHLQRLEDAGGKRVVIDFNPQGHIALQQLLAVGYGGTQKDAVVRAVVEAAERTHKK